MGHLDGARDAGAEPDAVVGARDIVVHGLWNRDYWNAALMEMRPVAQCVVTADRDQAVDAQEVEVLQHLVGDVVDVVLILVLQMRRHEIFW